MDSLDHRIRRNGQILCVNMKWYPLKYFFKEKLPSLHHFDKLFPHYIASAKCLSHGHKDNKFIISHLLKKTQKPSFEEHLKFGLVFTLLVTTA